MTEVLIRTNELPAAEVGRRFYDLYHAGETAEILDMRSIHGIGARYSRSPADAIAAVETGRDEADPLHYAIVDGDGGIYGWASSYLALTLGKSRLPVPGAIARGERGPKLPALFKTYPYAMPNIQAAVVAGREDLLFPAYQELARQNRPQTEFLVLGGVLIRRAWTLEAKPLARRLHRAQAAAHEAIKAAGLTAVADGWFDDRETTRSFIPRSTLYTTPSMPELSARSMLRELRTGKVSFWTEMDRQAHEEMGRNPIGR